LRLHAKIDYDAFATHSTNPTVVSESKHGGITAHCTTFSLALYECHGIWCARSPQSHVGPYLHAIDFLIPDGTPILAAQSGSVERFSDENNVWGDDPEFRDSVNFIDIRHAFGEVTEYCHLKKGSIRARGIKVGDFVKCGQIIGETGKTGWTDRDHLHFIVFRDDEGNPDNPLQGRKFKSLSIRFLSH